MACVLSAQESSTRPSLEAIKKQTKNVIDDFLRYLTECSNTQYNYDNDWLFKRVSKFFIESSQIEVSNKYNKNIVSYGYKKYLTEIIPGYPKRYAVTEIEAISDTAQLKPIFDSNNEIIGYRGTIKYTQLFKAKKYNQLINPAPQEVHLSIPMKYEDYDYVDTTVKEAEIFIKKLDTSGGAIWIIRIGNIKVLDTY
jgi:hypothetical protein